MKTVIILNNDQIVSISKINGFLSSGFWHDHSSGVLEGGNHIDKLWCNILFEILFNSLLENIDPHTVFIKGNTYEIGFVAPEGIDTTKISW